MQLQIIVSYFELMQRSNTQKVLLYNLNRAAVADPGGGGGGGGGGVAGVYPPTNYIFIVAYVHVLVD